MRTIYRQEGSEKDTWKQDYFVIALYLILSTAVLVFHEPWYDEAQAWQIARSESFYRIVFQVPHLEGHPPLWHLFLAVFAKNGFPYEMTIKTLVTGISGISVFLFVRKAPFCKGIRYIVPFTYFCFYQYRMICRPYCFTVLAFCLCSIFYPKRNKKAVPFLLSLLLLSGTSAYCIVLACVICVFWLADICKEQRGKRSCFLHDKRLWGLFILFLVNLSWVITLVPASNSATVPAGWDGFLRRFIYLLFFMPSEVFFTSFTGYNYAIEYDFDTAGIFIGHLLSNMVLLVPLGILFYRRRKLLQYIALHMSFCFFAAYSYLTVHHTGIIMLYMGYGLWCGYYENAREINFSKFRLETLHLPWNVIRKCWFILVFGISVFWSVLASWRDIVEPYGSGKEIAKIILENGSEQPNVLSEWKEQNPKIIAMYAVSSLPYLDKNPYINVGNGNKGAYRKLVTCTALEEQEIYKKWKEYEVPDILVGDGGIAGIYEEDRSFIYFPQKQVHCGFIWKDEYYPCDVLLYQKKSA